MRRVKWLSGLIVTIAIAIAGGTSLFEDSYRWAPLVLATIIGLPALTIHGLAWCGFLKPRESAFDRALRYTKEDEIRRDIYYRTGVKLPHSE